MTSKWVRRDDGEFVLLRGDGSVVAPDPVRVAYNRGYENGYREGRASGYDKGYSDSAYFFNSRTPEELEAENDEN